MDRVIFSDLSDIGQSTDMANEDDDHFNGEQSQQTDKDASMVTNNTNRMLEIRGDSGIKFIDIKNEEHYIELINVMATENLDVHRDHLK